MSKKSIKRDVEVSNEIRNCNNDVPSCHHENEQVKDTSSIPDTSSLPSDDSNVEDIEIDDDDITDDEASADEDDDDEDITLDQENNKLNRQFVCDGNMDEETRRQLSELLSAEINKSTDFKDDKIIQCLTKTMNVALDETSLISNDVNSQQRTKQLKADGSHKSKYVKQLINALNDSDNFLNVACATGYANLVKELLDVGKVKMKNPIALFEAAVNGNADCVQLLAEYGVDINAQSTSNTCPTKGSTVNGNTALHYAACAGHIDVVKILIEANANVEEQNENGHTPLMEAASAGHVEVAKVLLSAGAGINTHSNEFKESALTLACYKGHLEMVKFLLSAGADQEHKTDEMHTALMEASMDGHVEVAKLLLDSGAQVNMPAESFESPLTLAACGGHTDLAMLLIERGANLEEVNDEGYTPLMEAAREGHEEMVALLLSYGAKLNAQTEETQETALTLACCGGFLNVANFLITAGAELELGCSTPLMEASQEGHLQLVEFLLNAGANVHHETGTGDTALTYACENGHTAVAHLLISHGAKVEHESEGGRTPLMKSARSGHLATVQFLVKQGANVNRSTTNGDHTVLSLACAGGHLDVVKFLISNGSDVHHKLKDGSTMLIEAAKGGHTNVVTLLLEKTPKSLDNTENQLQNSRVPIDGLSNIVPPNIDSANGVNVSLSSINGQKVLMPSPPGRNVLRAQRKHPPPPPSTPVSDMDISAAVKAVSNFQNGDSVHADVEDLLSNLIKTIELNDTHIDRKKAMTEILKSHDNSSDSNIQNLVKQLQLLAETLKVSNSATLQSPPSILAPNEIDDEDLQEDEEFRLALQEDCEQTDIEQILRTDESINHILPPDLIESQADCAQEHQTAMRAFVESMKDNENRDMLQKWLTLNEQPTGSIGDWMKFDSDIFKDPNAQQRLIQHSMVLQQQLQTARHRQSIVKQQVVDKSDTTGQLTEIHLQIERLEERLRKINRLMQITMQHQNIQTSPPSKIEGDVTNTSHSSTQTNLPTSPKKQYVKSISPVSDLPHAKKQRKKHVHSNDSDCSLVLEPLTSKDVINNKTVSSNFKIDVDAQTESNHDTALTLACAGGHNELVKLLLSRNANIEHRDKKGFTPLILAATAGHADVVDTLVQHNAEIEAQSERTKDTPLSLACSGGRLDVVDYLLKKGSNKEHRNVSDYTPLSLAASGGYVNIIRLLLSNGAEINSRTGSKLGISPLMLAAMNGHTAAVKLLLEMGSDINAQIETNRNTALTLACFQGRHEVVKLLVERKANIEHRAKTGLTPLMEAASGGYVEVGQVLLDAFADVNAPPVPSSKDTALTIAADKGHFRFVELLLNHDALIEVKNKKGNSPLWLACNGGHYDVVQLLVSRHAQVDSRDNRKVSCLMAAFRKGHIKVVKWLVKHVQQFPLDQECERFIATINDEDLIKKCRQALEVITMAKERQAQEANKNADLLLLQLDMEKKHEANKKETAKRKREKRKAKKKGKTEVKDDDLCDEKSSKTPSPEPENKLIHNDRINTLELKEEVKVEPSIPEATIVSTVGPLKVANTPLRSSKINGSYQHHQNVTQIPLLTTQSTITSVKRSNLRPKKSRHQNENSPTTSTSISKTSSSGNNCISSSIVNSSLSSIVKKSSKTPEKSTANNSPKKTGKKDDGWKEVVTKKTQNPRSKKVKVPSSCISRVIGRGGCNINAIRELSGAHIEVEKQKTGCVDRMVTIKGSIDNIKEAETLIDQLINDPTKDLEHIPLTRSKSSSSNIIMNNNITESPMHHHFINGGGSPLPSLNVQTSLTQSSFSTPIVTSSNIMTPSVSSSKTNSRTKSPKIAKPSLSAPAWNQGNFSENSVVDIIPNTTYNSTTNITVASSPSTWGTPTSVPQSFPANSNFSPFQHRLSNFSNEILDKRTVDDEKKKFAEVAAGGINQIPYYDNSYMNVNYNPPANSFMQQTQYVGNYHLNNSSRFVSPEPGINWTPQTRDPMPQELPPTPDYLSERKRPQPIGHERQIHHHIGSGEQMMQPLPHQEILPTVTTDWQTDNIPAFTNTVGYNWQQNQNFYWQ